MKTDAEFDAFLKRELDEPPLPDHGFTQAVTARIERHRRSRLWMFAAAIAIAAPFFPFAAVTAETVVATLILATICSLVWIGTESAPPKRMTS